MSGDDWHHANLIRSFRSSNFEKTLKIWSKYWWFHIFERFLNSGRLDSTDFCCISSDISWQAYRVPTRHTLMKFWNGHFWPNRPFLTKQAIFVAILAKESIFQQTAPCGYSRLVSGDDWHHENLIRSFRSSNFEKTLKIWSKYWWFHIFKRFLNSGRLDSENQSTIEKTFKYMKSSIFWPYF